MQHEESRDEAAVAARRPRDGKRDKENGGKNKALAADPSLGYPKLTLLLRLQHEAYCNSLVTSCCTLLACASAAIPVWLRISYFDMLVVAAA
jgi:hypothetical protein